MQTEKKKAKGWGAERKHQTGLESEDSDRDNGQKWRGKDRVAIAKSTRQEHELLGDLFGRSKKRQRQRQADRHTEREREEN